MTAKARQSLLLSATVCLFSLPLLADAPPPEDFWQFYSEFADDQGELLDPDELASPIQTSPATPATDSPKSDSDHEKEEP